LERHHERLPGGVHDGVGDLEGPRVHPVERLEAHRCAHLGPGVAPGGHGCASGGEERLDVLVRVLDAQHRTERRHLVADPAVRGRLVLELVEPPGQMRLEGRAPGVRGALAVDPR
jgi:hypothetical protein